MSAAAVLALTAVAIGLVVIGNRPRKASAAPSSLDAPGKGLPMCDFKTVSAFNEYVKSTQGFYYNIFWVKVPISEWKAANVAYLDDPTSIVFSEAECQFYDWSLTGWGPESAINQEYWMFLGKDVDPACFTAQQIHAFDVVDTTEQGQGTSIIYNTFSTSVTSGIPVGQRQYMANSCKFMIWDGAQWIEDHATAARAAAWRKGQQL